MKNNAIVDEFFTSNGPIHLKSKTLTNEYELKLRIQNYFEAASEMGSSLGFYEVNRIKHPLTEEDVLQRAEHNYSEWVKEGAWEIGGTKFHDVYINEKTLSTFLYSDSDSVATISDALYKIVKNIFIESYVKTFLHNKI